MTTPLLAIEDLVKRWPGRGGALALDRVFLTIAPGERLALVGASGSGKTTLARIVLRLIEPDSGSVRFAGQDLLALRGEALRAVRPALQMVFQDPLAALNPRATVGRLLADPLRVHSLAPRAERPRAVKELLARVGLPSTLEPRYPHELSGGQRQRVAIARALACRPRFLVLDEPVSALDVSVRAQILNLLADIREAEGLTYLFISHDLAVVRTIADRIAVIAQGRIVETGAVEAVLGDPQAPETRALVAAVPRITKRSSPTTAGASP